MTNNIVIADPIQGQNLSVAGNAYRIITSGKQTDGKYAVIDMLVPPGGGPGPHAHASITEMFYVVEGEVEFRTEAGKQTAGKGSLITIPEGGDVHCFKNVSNAAARLLCTVMPAGLDSFFEEVGIPVEAGTYLPPKVPSAEEMVRLKGLAEKYGQVLFPPDYLG